MSITKWASPLPLEVISGIGGLSWRIITSFHLDVQEALAERFQRGLSNGLVMNTRGVVEKLPHLLKEHLDGNSSYFFYRPVALGRDSLYVAFLRLNVSRLRLRCLPAGRADPRVSIVVQVPSV